MKETCELVLERLYLKEDYTIGKLYVDGVFFCNVIEDKVRDFNKDGDLLDEGEEKVSTFTAIPYGRYKVVVTYSPKFKRELPLLVDVPHFTGIRIHEGKGASNSHGCLILGENKVVGGVINSAQYVRELISWIKIQNGMGKECYITIK